MRIRRLSLLAFGPFSGAILDFGEHRGGLDVVYGPNEAGKSTTLRSISGLLFGIPERTRDAHRHAPGDLRIGGLIETGNGTTIEVVRRKGRKGTLLDMEGRTLDDAVLAPALAGTTGSLFETMFGLDHESLRSSAEELLKGKGHVGESLFSAGAGAHDVRALRERLAEEADRLFTSRGRDQKTLTKLIAEVRAAREAVEESSTSVRGYLEQERALEEQNQAREKLSAERARLLAEQARLTRLSDVLPHLAHDEQVDRELAGLGDVVRLPADASERRRAAVKELDDAERAHERVTQEIARLEARLQGLGEALPIGALDESIIRDLEDRRGRHVAAENDLPKREGSLTERLEAVRRVLTTIDPGLTLADVDRLRIGASRGARILMLAQDRRDLDGELSQLGRQLSVLDAKRAQVSARLWPERVVDGLEPLHRLPIPTTEVVDGMAREWRALEARREATAAERERLRLRRRTIDQELDRLKKLGHVPTEAELARARSERDELIAAHAGARDGSAAVGGSIEGLWKSVRAADDLGDRLRREAERVYELANLLSEVEASEKEIGVLASRAREEAIDFATLDGKWQSLWSKTDVTVRTPAEMRSFSERFAQLVEVEVDRARVASEIEQKSAEADRWSAEWRGAIEPLPLTPAASVEEAMAVLDASGELLRQMEKVEELRKRIEGMQRDSARFAADTEKLCRSFLPEALSLPHAQAAERLSAAFRKARHDLEERARLSREIEEHRALFSKLAPRETSARDRVAALLREARVADLAALEDAERLSERARSLQEEREETRRKILALGEGQTLDVLVAETRGFDVDAARARRDEIAEELERVDDERQQVIARIAKIEAGMPTLRKGATDEATVLADRVARLKREGHRYLRARLAALLVDREIEKYRQANQGPILARAAELLPRLTLGSYSGLRVAFDDEDVAVLQCVRQDGKAVNVEALSDGTRDQLYLALRLSTLERYAQSAEPMPLVLDDVLIHFDDERARAALSVLAEVSRTTQVLFFTHHARLVELARTAVDPGTLRVHTLPSAD